jgi:hypothetical protein
MERKFGNSIKKVSGDMAPLCDADSKALIKNLTKQIKNM